MVTHMVLRGEYPLDEGNSQIWTITFHSSHCNKRINHYAAVLYSIMRYKAYYGDAKSCKMFFDKVCHINFVILKDHKIGIYMLLKCHFNPYMYVHLKQQPAKHWINMALINCNARVNTTLVCNEFLASHLPHQDK